MRDEEKQINKYKEQGRGTKKEHQLAPEPDKYVIDNDKMIGSSDMLSASEKKNFIISAMARKSAICWFLALLILPLGALLVVGAANVTHSHYMLGDIFETMIASYYRPFAAWSFGIIFAMIVISGLIIKFVYSDKKRLIIRANDKMVEEGLEPVVIPRRDGDKNKLISAFYKVKPPYAVLYVIVIAALVLLAFHAYIVYSAANRQKVATDTSRADAVKTIENSFDGYQVKKSHEIMAFVDRYKFKVGDHVTLSIDLDENGKVLDASYMVYYKAKYSYDDLEKMKAKGVLSEMRDVQKKSQGFKDLFVYPEVTEVPIKFSNYMTNYIDNIREKSSWEKDYDYKVGEHTYIAHCGVSYSEGKKKGTGDDKLTVTYDIQQKNFKRTQW